MDKLLYYIYEKRKFRKTKIGYTLLLPLMTMVDRNYTLQSFKHVNDFCLVGNPEGKRRMERPRRRWEDNIKMDLQKVGGGGGDWMEQAQNRDRWRALVSTVMNFPVP
jgi:hypothetical protein